MPDEHLHISTAGSVNPHATSVNDTYNIYETPRPSRMSVYLQKLHVDIESNATREINGELLEYKTKLDGTKGLEEKLTEGGFSREQINEALRKKGIYTQKAIKFECFPSAQEINLLLFADIKNRFDVYVFPLIRKEVETDLVMQCIHEKVVNPIMVQLNIDGEFDEDLHYTSDHIYGMMYFLIDTCHLSWKAYDDQ